MEIYTKRNPIKFECHLALSYKHIHVFVYTVHFHIYVYTRVRIFMLKVYYSMCPFQRHTHMPNMGKNTGNNNNNNKKNQKNWLYIIVRMAMNFRGLCRRCQYILRIYDKDNGGSNRTVSVFIAYVLNGICCNSLKIVG